MAQIRQKREQNVNGNFYVDETCIDCDTCRWMTPEVFTHVEEKQRALQALLSCPTASIGTLDKPTKIKSVQDSFPIPISRNSCRRRSKD